MTVTGALFEKAEFRIAGDQGLLVEYGDAIDLAVNHKVRAMAIALGAELPEGVIEVIPTYRSLLIVYDPLKTAPQILKEILIALEQRLPDIQIPPPKTVEIPVCYGDEFGPDIEFVAKVHGLSVEEVVRQHCEPLYPIYMIGFTPGFPFLGGLPETLHTPRLETPRTLVPEGSVGIANNQTGMYPVASPGGWQLIGRTPLKLFAPERPDPFLYQAGDCIKFKAISRDEYARLKE
jgi:KipI family sensor histidine kinase inhibitor